MSNMPSYTVIAALVALIAVGGIFWYWYDHRPGPVSVPAADLVPNRVPDEVAKTLIPATYLRAASDASGATTLSWSSAPNAKNCQILRYSSRPQNATPDKTYDVDADGTLAVEDGFYYRLQCKGKDVTIQSDIDLLTL